MYRKSDIFNISWHKSAIYHLIRNNIQEEILEKDHLWRWWNEKSTKRYNNNTKIKKIKFHDDASVIKYWMIMSLHFSLLFLKRFSWTKLRWMNEEKKETCPQKVENKCRKWTNFIHWIMFCLQNNMTEIWWNVCESKNKMS